MASANLINSGTGMNTDNESIVIVDNFQSKRGGATLDVTGFTPDIIPAGHLVIKETSTGELKPMPVTVSGAITTTGAVSGGASYTNGTYNAVDLTGGSGTGATADIVVAGTVVSSVTIVDGGEGYADGDILSADAADIGGTGTGFQVAVSGVDNTGSGYDALPGGHTYEGVVIANTLTAKPMVGIMYRGTVNPNASTYDLTDILTAVKAALPLIIFKAD